MQNLILHFKKLEDVEFKNMLRSEEDRLNCVLQINAGAGGTESCDGKYAYAHVFDVGRKAGL